MAEEPQYADDHIKQKQENDQQNSADIEMIDMEEIKLQEEKAKYVAEMADQVEDPKYSELKKEINRLQDVVERQKIRVQTEIDNRTALEDERKINKELLDAAVKEKENLKEKLEEANYQLKQYPELQREVEYLRKGLGEWQRYSNQLKCAFQSSEDMVQRKTNDVKHLKKELDAERAKKDAVLTRLSELAGAKITEGNSAIADLSDAHRPQKLAEVLSEIYDNEWTDCLEIMTKDGTPDKNVIGNLLCIVQDIHQFCSENAANMKDSMDENLKKAFNLSAEDAFPGTVSKKLKDFLKSAAQDFLPVVERNFRTTAVQMKGDCTKEMEKYMRKCLAFSWYACLQDPPLDLTFDMQENETYDSDLQKQYTSSGAYIDFIVWPILRLEKNGHLLGKGVVQCKKEKSNVEIQAKKDVDNITGKEMNTAKGGTGAPKVTSTPSDDNSMGLVGKKDEQRVTENSNATVVNDGHSIVDQVIGKVSGSASENTTPDDTSKDPAETQQGKHVTRISPKGEVTTNTTPDLKNQVIKAQKDLNPSQPSVNEPHEVFSSAPQKN